MFDYTNMYFGKRDLSYTCWVSLLEAQDWEVCTNWSKYSHFTNAWFFILCLSIAGLLWMW